jgi:hypothetical protein
MVVIEEGLYDLDKTTVETGDLVSTYRHTIHPDMHTQTYHTYILYIHTILSIMV